mmetsp:Transcript_130244/g.229300  ORF Transcript_130244/g.229300 Transcript_130244/m.229300 type:complete len:203 (-) Transcript_130244:739-1347(-)
MLWCATSPITGSGNSHLSSMGGQGLLKACGKGCVRTSRQVRKLAAIDGSFWKRSCLEKSVQPSFGRHSPKEMLQQCGPCALRQQRSIFFRILVIFTSHVLRWWSFHPTGLALSAPHPIGQSGNAAEPVGKSLWIHPVRLLKWRVADQQNVYAAATVLRSQGMSWKILLSNLPPLGFCKSSSFVMARRCTTSRKMLGPRETHR